MIGLDLILAHNRTGRADGAVSNPAWAHKAALPAHENRALVYHHAARHITQKRGRGLVLIGGEIEMNERAAHFAVVAAGSPVSHQAIAKIDQAAQGYERHENGLL